MTYTPDPWLILSKKSDLAADDISQMSSEDAWEAIAQLRDLTNENHDPAVRRLRMCFVGFSPELKEKLGDEAFALGFLVDNGLTKNWILWFVDQRLLRRKFERPKSLVLRF